jgi:hypothetical protein
MEEWEVVDFRWRSSNADSLRRLFSAPFVSVAADTKLEGMHMDESMNEI